MFLNYTFSNSNFFINRFFRIFLYSPPSTRSDCLYISLYSVSLSTLSLPQFLYFESDVILTKVNPQRSFSSSEAETEKTEEEEEDDCEDIGVTVVCSCDIHHQHQVKSPGYFSS